MINDYDGNFRSLTFRRTVIKLALATEGKIKELYTFMTRKEAQQKAQIRMLDGRVRANYTINFNLGITILNHRKAPIKIVQPWLYCILHHK